MRERKGRFDYFLMATVTLLIFWGVIILVSISFPLSQERFGHPGFYLLRHLLGLSFGFLLGLAALKTPLSLIKKRTPIFLLVNLFLMLLVFTPKIGITLGGATRWINLGIISFQPSEFLKLTFILYLAAWLEARTEKTKKTAPPAYITAAAFFLILCLLGLFLIFQPDISTLAVIIFTSTLMYFSAGPPFRYFLMIFLAEIGALIGLMKTASYRFQRLLVFLKPEIDPMGLSYQAKQALMTIGAGGIWGVGLGTSIQKFFLPQPMTDSVFAVFSEEAGLVGGLTLIILFLLFAWKGYRVAQKSKNKFYKLTAVGITSWIVLQAFVNIGAMAGMLPLTGIPLPFISYGGTALAAELTGIGILLNISRQINV